MKLVMVAAALVLALSGSVAARADDVLRYGLEFDPDVLDPARAGSYTDRIVFTSMCDQLLDVDEHLAYVPMLATAWEWSADNLALTLHLRPGVRFQDGAAMDADAVRANFVRNRTAQESQRKTELKPISDVEVVDPLTVRIRLSHPYAPLLSLLANRPGIMLSPNVLGRSADAIAADPVCAGPYKFTERVAQDRIVLDRFPGYWDAAAMKWDAGGPRRVVFLPIVDPTVRLADLRAGQLDVANRLAATDAAAVASNPALQLVTSPSLGFQLISFNVAHGPRADTPLGRDPRVRQALDKAIDRQVLNQVVYDGRFVPNAQTEAPGTQFWDPAAPVPPRDLDGARALLRQAGVSRVAFTLLTGNDAVAAQVGQVIQSMAAEAGFDITLQATESLAGYAMVQRGDYQASLVIWSGRPDPDGNASVWMQCDGFLNWGRYCNKDLDALFAQGSALTDPAARVPVYRQIVQTYRRDLPQMVLYHFTWLWGVGKRLHGFHGMPDGIMRPTGLTLQ